MADNYCNCCGDGTPEYIIELNQQGAPGKRGEKGEQGYSPVVDFIVDDNEIKFTSTNENNVTSTPNLYDFVLKRDGSNALNPIKLNRIYIKNNSIYTQSSSIDFGDSSSNKQHIANIYYKNIILKGNSPYLENDHGTLTIRGKDSLSIETVSGNISLGNTIHITDNIPYIGPSGANNKIATIGDIPEVSNSKVTISQGDVVKGSFTLNQSGDTTIKLDTGVTNPLKIEGATEDNPSGGTVTYSMELGLDSSNKVYLNRNSKFVQSGSISEVSENIVKDNQIYAPIYKTARIVDNDVNRRLTIGYDTDSKLYIRNYLTNSGNTYKSIAPITSDITNYPIYLEEVTGTPGLEGAYTIKLNYDNNTLKLNESNQLYTDFTEVNNSISELTTLANNTEASLNGLKTDYEANKTEVAGELTNLGNQINTKVSKTELDKLADTKNDNIFDIGKFTVVGSPVISDDGVASGFSASNIITISDVPTFDKPFKVCFKVKTGDLSSGQSTFYSNGGDYYNAISAYGGEYPIFQVTLKLSDGSEGGLPSVTGVQSFTEYTGFFSWTGTEYRLHIDGLTDGVYQSSLALSTASNTTVKLGCLYTNEVPFTGSIDLKQFSITVDGKEVFNGLMSSTKPIYDKITTTNTTLSTFQTDTTNNFSAVNSALNEKANLSDLANYVPLATYNQLSDVAVKSSTVRNIVQISQTDYDALGTKDSNTLYIIV